MYFKRSLFWDMTLQHSVRAYPVKQRHIPEGWSPAAICLYSLIISSKCKCVMCRS
jgi:hypothetical protein